MTADADLFIEKLGLVRHPEGGYYRETYRSKITIGKRPPFDGERACSTAIYFLLKAGDVSKLHRIKSDELWHHYAGDPIEIVSICADGAVRKSLLGKAIEKGERPQAVVPAGDWFGARVAVSESDASAFCLVGCTVAPGFDFADFEMGRRDELIDLFPLHAEIIRSLT